jgi:hypothetical protein
VAALKRAVYEGGAKPLEQGLALERALFLSLGGRPASLRAMRAYVEELERRGEPPWRDPEVMAAWQEGTAADLSGDAG